MTTVSLDIIGTIYTSPVFNEAGDMTSAPQPIPGWHVNASDEVEGWETLRVYPATPVRVFAGHSSVCYVFTDEVAFKEAALQKGLISPEEVLV